VHTCARAAPSAAGLWAGHGRRGAPYAAAVTMTAAPEADLRSYEGTRPTLNQFASCHTHPIDAHWAKLRAGLLARPPITHRRFIESCEHK
jgi:hypothetical protein